MKICFALLLFGVVMNSCNTKSQDNNLDVPFTTIDFFLLKEKSLDNVIKVNKCENFILLKSNNNKAQFGRIDKVKIKNKRIYITDTRLKMLVVFDDIGNSIGAVGRLGQGPHEYLNIADFDVDNSGNIYMLDGRLNKVFVYNSSLEYLKSIDLPFEADILQLLDNGNLMFGLSSWNSGKKEGAKIVTMDHSGNIIQSYFNYDRFVDPTFWISNYCFSKSSKCIAYNQTINNDVYVFSFFGELQEIIRFDFGKYNVPDNDKLGVESKISNFDDYCLIKKILGVTNDYIIGSIWKQRETKIFIIDRKSGICYLSGKINDLDRNFMCGFSDPFIVSNLDFENDTLYPDSVNAHLRSENNVLKIQKLEI